jgi:hypothetical protein
MFGAPNRNYSETTGAQWVYLPLGPMDLLLRDRQDRSKLDNSAPREVIDKAWRRYIVQKDGRVIFGAYTLCA